MDSLATRGYAVLDDAQVRLRTNGVPTRFTELFALKADQSTVDTGLGDRPTQVQVTAQILAAIDALRGSAPALLDTLAEIAQAINDDQDVHATILRLLGAKQATLTVPVASGVSRSLGACSRILCFRGPPRPKRPLRYRWPSVAWAAQPSLPSTLGS